MERGAVSMAAVLAFWGAGKSCGGLASMGWGQILGLDDRLSGWMADYQAGYPVWGLHTGSGGWMGLDGRFWGWMLVTQCFGDVPRHCSTSPRTATEGTTRR